MSFTAAVAEPARRGAAPLRIAHVIDTLRPGGAEQLLLTTTKHLASAGFESLVVVVAPPLDLRDDFVRLGIAVHVLNARGAFDWRRGVVGLTRVLRRYRPHIVHTHLIHSNLFGRVSGLLARTPAVVTTLHACDYSHWSSDTLRFKCRKALERVLAPRVNAAHVAVSRTVRDDYVAHFGLDNVEVIYNYLDPGDFSVPSAGQVEAARRELGLTGRELVILNVARMAWDKGQRHLVAAMGEIRARIPDARLLLAGAGPERAPLEDQARALGIQDAVTFLGNRRDIATLLALTDVFVFPSVVEGFGIALLEAMMMRRPVVASATEGIAEIVEDGEDGLLVPPAEPAAIVKAVLALHDDPALRRRLGEAAGRTVARRFSVNVGVRRLIDFYESVARRRDSVARRRG